MNVGVFRGDFGAALAQSLLHDTQVFGLLIEVCAAAVAKEMTRVAGLLEPCIRQCLVDDVADADARDAPVPIVRRTRDDGRCETILGRYGTARFDVRFEKLKRLLAWVDDPRMPFPPDLDAPALPVDVLVREAHDLDDAQSLDAHEVDDEEVAQSAQGVLVRREPLADLLDLIDGEIFIVLVEVLRIAQLQIGAGILSDEGEALCNLVKGTDCRALDHERCRAVATRAHLLHVDANLVIVYVTERVESLLHAPVEEEANRQFVRVARVRCGRTARDVARKVFVEMGDEIFGRNGVLPYAHGYLAHTAHIAGGGFRTPRRNAHFLRTASAIGLVSRQKVTLFHHLLYCRDYIMKRVT